MESGPHQWLSSVLHIYTFNVLVTNDTKSSEPVVFSHLSLVRKHSTWCYRISLIFWSVNFVYTKAD